VLVAALLVSAATAAPSPIPPAAGTIQGHVTFSRMAPQRVANRYPGAGGGASHRAGTVPAVAYLVGPVAGVSAESRPRPRLLQQDTSFQPPVLVIPVGTSVEFPNRDPFFHNVFSYSATKRFDLGRYPRGESRTVVFDRPGIVKVYCEIHQWMRSAVLVVENPFHAQVGADGAFTIPGVPPGRYRLAVWDFDRGQRVVDVTVPAQGSARVDVSL
jgi:plastocyanin